MTREAPRPALPLPACAPFVPPPFFAEELAKLGVTLDDAQAARLGDYLARLVAMNELLNLTAVTDPVEVWRRHGVDALSLVPHLAHLPAGGRLLDVGSGGGVPGIPLAIARPDLELTLLEATQKKAQFLVDVSEAIGLTNVEVYAERAEDMDDSVLTEAYDVVTARAVAKIENLLAWTAPFAKRGGHLLFIKGERAPEELKNAKRALARFGCTHERTVVGATGRVVVLRVG